MRGRSRVRQTVTLFALTLALGAGFLGSCDAGGGGVDDGIGDVIPGADARDVSEGDSGGDGSPEPDGAPDVIENPGIDAEIYAVAGGCYALELHDGRPLQATEGGGDFVFAGMEMEEPAAFRLRPTDLGEYVFYDAERHYFIADRGSEGEGGVWQTARTADKVRIHIPIEEVRSDAEWRLEPSGWAVDSYHLRHLNSGLYLGEEGLVEEVGAAAVRLTPREGCVEYPELTLDAHGEVRSAPWDDGAVFGVADVHEHIFVSQTFGGGGVFHGATFHRLGVEHALGDCEAHHGVGGEKDVLGYFFHGDRSPDVEAMLQVLGSQSIGEFSHHTDGYPTFTDWPNPRHAGMHNVTYYRWLERAWMGGLRLIVSLQTGNSVYCQLAVGLGTQEAPLGCNDMYSVALGLESARAMVRYIDALSGGPGKGWLRIVESPAEAREAINEGKLAMVLGIEISNLYDCFLTPPPGMPACDAGLVREQVEKYHQLGVRVVFPVHKYDNGFAPGDGQRGAMELGNLINSGHYANFVEDCPGLRGFDRGGVEFGGLNKPREVYDAPPVLDMTEITTRIVAALLPLLPDFNSGRLEGEFCQNGTLTALGEVLLDELMARGTVIDVAHMPQWALSRTIEIFDARGYPMISTHGNSFGGAVFRDGGLTQTGLGRCGDPDQPGRMIEGYLAKAAELQAANGLTAMPLGFDFNGLAGGPGPRFGEESGCSQPQVDPITYPFTSYDGQVEFSEPQLGVRAVDFNTEGMLHIGLLPEYIEDVRRDGATDEQLEPLFRTAEVFLQVWESAYDQRSR